MARAKTKKSKAELEGEEWVKDKIAQIISLENETKILACENQDLACENKLLKETVSKLDTEIIGLNTSISIYLTKKTELEAQIRVLREIILDMLKNK